jgi:hypothetical protein
VPEGISSLDRESNRGYGMTQTNAQVVMADIELALQGANKFLPEVLNTIGLFYPPAMALAKFLPLLQVALQGVNIVADVQGASAATATAAVIDHLTPGAPGAPALDGPPKHA